MKKISAQQNDFSKESYSRAQTATAQSFQFSAMPALKEGSTYIQR